MYGMQTIEMTTSERLRAALANQPTDRVPFAPFLAYVWEHWPESIRAGGQAGFLRSIGADPLWRGAPCPVRVDDDPRVVRRQSQSRDLLHGELETPVGSLHWAYQHSLTGDTGFLIEHPVKSVADLETLRWLEEHCRFEVAPEAARAWLAEHDDGLALGMLLPRGKSAWQHLVEHQVGTEELVYLALDEPEALDATWQAMAANDRRCVELAATSDTYDHWLTWEDSSTQNYDPGTYQARIGDEIAAWCAVLAEAGGQRYVQHACGHLRDLVSLMRDGGVYAVESLSPPPTGNLTLVEARSLVGADLGIIGGIEPTRLLDLDQDDLPAYVEQVCLDGVGGPFVLANADSCPPGVTPEKFAHICACVRRE